MFANDIYFTNYNKQSISLQSDNDAYFAPTDYDRYYTAGHNLTYTSKEFINNPLKYVGFSLLINTNPISRFSIGLGQELYSPADRLNPNPSLYDYPFAGFLYMSGMVQNRVDDFMEQIFLDIGIIGNAALGQETQDIIHSLTNNPKLPGWRHQIKNEFIFNIYYKAMYRFPIIDNIIEILPYGILALGNAHTHLEIGVKLRIGWGLHGDFGIPKAITGHIGSTSINDDFRIYIQGGFGERLIGRNIFLQGNTIGGYQSLVALNYAIYEAEIGVLVAWKGCALSFMFSNRQKEFVQQLRNHNYATLRLEISF